ncbi:hypothetical protein APHAL10511_002894 [Amanita phalloides]|nr:hypothetical protein APHAL10511_002894 [Amanita phalloides]
MRAATGPLQSGIYISQAVDYPDEYGTVNDGASNVELTGNSQTDNVKWNVERIGDDLFRIGHLLTNASTRILPGQDTAVGLGEGPSEFIIKETDVKGEYSISPAEHPTLFYHGTKVQGELKVTIGPNMTRSRFFSVDN